MHLSWVETSEYFGDDIDDDGNLFGLGGSLGEDVRAAAEANAARNKDTLAQAYASFRSQGVAGKALQAWLKSGLEPLCDAVITMYRHNPVASGMSAARDLAYKVKYEIDSRPEMKVDSRVPDWLLDQQQKTIASFIDAVVKASPESMITTGAKFTYEAAAWTAQQAGEMAKKIPKAVTDSLWDAIPLSLKIAGGLMLVVLSYTFYKVATSSAKAYIQPPGYRGLQGARKRRCRRRRHSQAVAVR